MFLIISWIGVPVVTPSNVPERISTASASIMTTLIKNQSLEQADKLFETFHALVTHPEHVPDQLDLGKMAVFAGVNEFPARVKCATLPWHTMKNAVGDTGEEALFIDTAGNELIDSSRFSSQTAIAAVPSLTTSSGASALNLSTISSVVITSSGCGCS